MGTNGRKAVALLLCWVPSIAHASYDGTTELQVFRSLSGRGQGPNRQPPTEAINGRLDEPDEPRGQMRRAVLSRGTDANLRSVEEQLDVLVGRSSAKAGATPEQQRKQQREQASLLLARHGLRQMLRQKGFHHAQAEEWVRVLEHRWGSCCWLMAGGGGREDPRQKLVGGYRKKIFL